VNFHEIIALFHTELYNRYSKLLSWVLFTVQVSANADRSARHAALHAYYAIHKGVRSAW